MPTFNVCGTLYPYPNVGDNPWGTIHINWAAAVSACLTSVNSAIATTFPNPMTAVGDIIYEDITLAPARLPIGTTGQVLTVDVAGIPVWAPSASGTGNVPIGSILPWCDFNGTLLLDPNYRYMDGTVVAAVGSPINGQTLDDLSGAYIVGYGTLGGGNIGTALYAATPVGNINHQIDVSHTHTMSGSAIQGLLATSNAGSHDHSGDTNGMSLNANQNSADYDIRDDSAGWTTRLGGSPYHISVQSGNNNEGQHDHDISTDGTHSHNVTGSGSANTGTSLSATQSIQPRSQRYRYIIRVL